MRWDARIDRSLRRVGRGARITVDGTEVRRVVAFDTEEGWVLVHSSGGECGCEGATSGSRHLRRRSSEFAEFAPDGSEINRVLQPCMSVHHGRVEFTPGEGARPNPPAGAFR